VNIMDHHPIDRLIHRDSGPHLHTTTASASDVADLAVALANVTKRKVAARVVRGNKCRTMNALFDEFAAAWQFPPYFGENWNALDECLADLEWLPAEAYVLLITDAPALLVDDKPEAFGLFVDLIDGIARGWKDASFQVVFQAESGEESQLADRLKKTGKPFDAL